MTCDAGGVVSNLVWSVLSARVVISGTAEHIVLHVVTAILVPRYMHEFSIAGCRAGIAGIASQEWIEQHDRLSTPWPPGLRRGTQQNSARIATVISDQPTLQKRIPPSTQFANIRGTEEGRGVSFVLAPGRSGEIEAGTQGFSHPERHNG